MEATAGMVAGSYNRNELVRIRHDSTDSGKDQKPIPTCNNEKNSQHQISSKAPQVFNFHKQCQSFKKRANEAKEGLEKRIPGINVSLNPDKKKYTQNLSESQASGSPSDGCFPTKSFLSQMDAFMRQFGDPPPFPGRFPDDRTDSSGGFGAFVAS